MEQQEGSSLNRRDFVRTSLGVGMAAAISTSNRRILGANDRINLAFIGVGGRGRSLLREVMGIGEESNDVQVIAVCDVYEKRKRLASEVASCTGYLDYEEILEREDVDAIVNATPDHWHAAISIEAMEKGKDVYLEKPMTHTIEEAKQVVKTVKETGRVLQVGSQTTSRDQWWKAREIIQKGLIGKLLMSQGSYHRNSVEGEWNWTIEPDAGPNGRGENYINWEKWLGPAPRREWEPERFFRFRKFWDYSGGIATDLFYHVVAPLQICWGKPQFPYRVTAGGGIYQFKDREVPDTFHLMADFAEEHSLVLSSTMANNDHIPGLLRGHEGTIMMVPAGRFEGQVDFITVTPQSIVEEDFYKTHKTTSLRIPMQERESHMRNFLRSVRTREKPVLDADTGYKAQVTITMSVMAYRQGKVLYFDPREEKVVDTPPLL